MNTELLNKLKGKIYEYGCQASIEYIGITSGNDGPMKAMKSRVYSKKRDLGINYMLLLYETTSDYNCREVERHLIDYSRQIHQKMK